MRKSAITCFAFLYGILVFTTYLERLNEWMGQEAFALQHFASSQHLLCIAKAEKSDSHLQYKKIVERPFAVEAPREAIGTTPTCSLRHIALPFFDPQAGWSGQRVTLRAPPYQI